jgi:hypothetical protein
MRIIVFSIFLIAIQTVLSQKRFHEFRSRMPSIDEYAAFENSTIPSVDLDYLNVGLDGYEKVLQYGIVENTRTRNKKAYERSEALMECAKIIHENMKHKHFKEVKQITSYEKKLYLILPASTTKFKIVKAFAFNLPVLKSPINFYRDIKSEVDPYHLYIGKRPSVKERASSDYNPKPLERFTPEEFVKKINRIFKSKKIEKLIRPGYAKYVGYSIRINPKTINKSIAPELEVIVIFGIQQMQKVKK